jgi:RNA polymerase sigma-70 factor (sigma-E family)
VSPQGEEFGEFVQRRAAPLHRTAYLLCGDWHLANDLVQEALAKTYRNWARVQRADSPDAYVRRILVNEANRHWRRQKMATTGHETTTDIAVTGDATNEIVRRDGLLRGLLALPARQRATIVLRYLEGLTERETATVLRCSEGTVKSQTSRALAALKTYLEREESLR